MLVPLLVLQIATGVTPAESMYASPSLRAFVATAADANRAPPASLHGYRARVESELSLLIRDTLGRERTAQVEQVAMNAAWQRDQPAFPNYPGGSWGPPSADELLHRDGRSWRRH